jgi:two-component system, chemotaxis family, CheB/CheR fusion protein
MTGTARKHEEGDSAELASLLEYLKTHRGFDFNGYKRTSLERRFRKRMDAVGAGAYGEYEDYLQVHPDEFKDLFDTILINVTGFFRDQPAWDFLAEDVIPKLLEDTPSTQPIRVWSAACASGEEAYSVAMLLAEALGEDEFRQRVKIYATDVDEDALAEARHGAFSARAVKPVPAELREKYFDRGEQDYLFRSDLRRSVIFGRNDLVQDAPISRVDLLISRNALIYFTSEAQARILSRFHFSLRDPGFLFLGKSETLTAHADRFAPYNLKWRFYKKIPRELPGDRLAIAPQFRFGEEAASRYSRLVEGSADVAPVAQLTVDRRGYLAAANEIARVMFDIGAVNLGRPLSDLEVSYKPIELRSLLDEAYQQRRQIDAGRVGWPTPDGERTLDVHVTPLYSDIESGDSLGASVTFVDVTAMARLDDRHQVIEHELENAYEELQSTVEELETTNEELQSTNEELETTNEELQSTNEELETMNEELQSTNDELEVMNDEQRVRGDEVDRLNMFLEGILGNLGVGVVVLDAEQRVQLWNSSATELWGLRGDEVDGRPFLALDMGLPVDDVREAIDDAVADGGAGGTVTVAAIDRRGRSFDCTVRALPLRTRDGNSYGVILLMSGVEGQVPGPNGGAG